MRAQNTVRRGGVYVVVRVLDLQVRVRTARLHITAPGKLFTHTCVSVTKQYSLVPANGR